METLAELVIAIFIVIGGVFGLVGSVGLIKLTNTMQRLHAPTKATTLGVGGVLIASMLYFAIIKDDISIHELLITLFLFLTAPIIANFIAKSYMAANVRPRELPETGHDYGWAVYDDPPHPDDEKKPGGV